jgi:hypothetical protein
MDGNDRHCDPTGFVATDKKERIEICAPVTSISWMPVGYKVPLITGEDSKRVMLYVMPILSTEPHLRFQVNLFSPIFEVPIYHGYKEDLENGETDSKRFVYTGNRDNKSETQNQYILFDDLKSRLTRGCEDVYVRDWGDVDKKVIPFLVWRPEGELIRDENNFLASTNDLQLNERVKAQFLVFCGTWT